MLNKEIFENREKIKEDLRFPFIKLSNAFEDNYAENLRNELLKANEWKIQGDQTMSEKTGQNVLDSFKYTRKGITLGQTKELLLLDNLYQYLNSQNVLKWMSYISGRRCDFFEGSATIFGPGDRITKHNDLFNRRLKSGSFQSRALTFNYWLTKEWEPSFGGQLVWENPFEEIVPSFNTLVLFLPTQLSHHWVETVSDSVEIPRLAISGWFMTDRSKDQHRFKLNIEA